MLRQIFYQGVFDSLQGQELDQSGLLLPLASESARRTSDSVSHLILHAIATHATKGTSQILIENDGGEKDEQDRFVTFKWVVETKSSSSSDCLLFDVFIKPVPWYRGAETYLHKAPMYFAPSFEYVPYMGHNLSEQP